MAIRYVEEKLPAVAQIPFKINSWLGVNKIKGALADGEMYDCINMGSGYYPYASPRPSRELVYAEEGIKRLYKKDGNRVYFIDSNNNLACTEDGVKNTLLYTSPNGAETVINVTDCLCTNNYDFSTVFYPNMVYVDKDGSLVYMRHEMEFEAPSAKDQFDCYVTDSAYGEGYRYEVTQIVPVYDTSKREIEVDMILPEGKYSTNSNYQYPEWTQRYVPRIRIKIYSADGKVKTYNLNGVSCTYIEEIAYIRARENIYKVAIPDEITLSEGDYIEITLGLYYKNNDFDFDYWVSILSQYLTADWYINGSLATLSLDYGVVYNNRIVGVKGNAIRASALGDFTNFSEFADEAGNPSATGAYATDVGSAGDFTGICAYKNVLLLFKKDIVYEMYGSMPYTITELCNEGCVDNDSICQIEGILYWASPKGIVRYNGGVPKVISHQVNIDTSGVCKAGTEGRRYYIYNGKGLYVYDTYYDMWHIEEAEDVRGFLNHLTDLYMIQADGIYKLNSGSEQVRWEFETKEFTFNAKERKNLSKLWVRADMSKNSYLEIYASQNGGEFKRVAVKTAERDEMFDFKLRVKKCDSFKLKLRGKGDVKILDVEGKVTAGTSKHRSGKSLNVYRR